MYSKHNVLSLVTFVPSCISCALNSSLHVQHIHTLCVAWSEVALTAGFLKIDIHRDRWEECVHAAEPAAKSMKRGIAPRVTTKDHQAMLCHRRKCWTLASKKISHVCFLSGESWAKVNMGPHLSEPRSALASFAISDGTCARI